MNGFTPPGPAAEAPEVAPERKPKYQWTARQYIALLVIFGLVAVLRLYVVESDIVQGESMAPTLRSDDYVLIYKLAYRGGRVPARGDVVTFDSPLQPGEALVKRVVAVPGDTVQLSRGRVWVNGKPAGYTGDPPQVPVWDSPEVVPEGHVFVLGDNRANSEDSRDWGPLEIGALRGRALLVYFPPGRMGLVR